MARRWALHRGASPAMEMSPLRLFAPRPPDSVAHLLWPWSGPCRLSPSARDLFHSLGTSAVVTWSHPPPPQACGDPCPGTPWMPRWSTVRGCWSLSRNQPWRSIPGPGHVAVPVLVLLDSARGSTMTGASALLLRHCSAGLYHWCCCPGDDPFGSLADRDSPSPSKCTACIRHSVQCQVRCCPRWSQPPPSEDATLHPQIDTEPVRATRAASVLG
jgi:hypothetical protein